MDIVPVYHCFWLVVLLNHWAIVHIVLHCCFRRYFIFFLVFQFFTRTSFTSLFNHYAHLGKYVHISYWYVQTMHVSLQLLYSLPVDSIGHKTGTRPVQVKNTRLPLHVTEPFRMSGALAPWSYPDLIPAGLEPSKLTLDTSKYIISRRQVYLWVNVPQKRAKKL